ncbi:cytochrome b [Qipengyuania oceanensis]|uniref:Cytochrome b n=1 Tax=Qipengyuania oceanensis TaxID=1463597 RepID=A0A844YI74_9SPHN|nr:cytochrome b [Qipengyuania oceanensis]MXO63627.1 cytochrome b [Qipengyuania oceanensis]
MSAASQRRYSTGAMVFHWLIAIAVIANWWIAEQAHDLPQAERGALMGWHFTIGITILILTVLRIVWRVTHPVPPMSDRHAGWERFLARATHTLFYILLIGLPLGAWIGLSGYDSAISFWGLFSIPALPVGFGEETGHEILELHASGGTFMMILVVLHVLGALKHQFIDRDGELYRMLPFGQPKG